MRELAGRVGCVTGASRGIGERIARALAKEGVRLVLVARSADALEALAVQLRKEGAEVHVCPADVGTSAGRDAIEAAGAALGGIDLLVNNAGIETIAPLPTLSEEALSEVLRVNLEAPILLTRRLLPGMIERRRGHVVNLASLAGLAGSADGESYCAGKHGLVGFTRALRASARTHGWGLSASAVCPGYVRDVGMYVRFQQESGVKAPALLGTSAPDDVARAVVAAVKRDLADVIVNPGPMRPALALGLLLPRVGEWVAQKLGGNEVFAATGRARR